MAQLYPIFLDLTDRPVLLAGGGPVAARKAAALLERQIRVSVVAPEICPELAAQASNAALVINQRAYQSNDLADSWLVIAATDDPELNRMIFADATRARIFCNVVDQPELCSFQVPAVVRRGLLQIAVSTGGASPALAGRIRRQLEEQFSPAYARLLDGLLELRHCFQQKYPNDPSRRRELLLAFLDSDAPGLLLGQSAPESFAVELEKWKSR